MDKFTLKSWQEVVINEIKNHDILIKNSEILQSYSDAEINRETQIRIKFPKGSGHTVLSAYILSAFNTAFIYENYGRLKKVYDYRKQLIEEDITTNNDISTPISAFEIFYALNQANLVNCSHKDINRLENIKKQILEKNVILIDYSSIIPPIVEEYILNISRGTVIFLG